MDVVFGGVEGGGTKFVCLLGTGPDHIVDEIRFPTTTPDATLGRIIAFFTTGARGHTTRCGRRRLVRSH